MVFSSALFLTLFLPLVLVSYSLVRENLRVYLLLAASLFFYAWGEPKAIFCMLAMIVVNYCAAILIDKGVISFFGRNVTRFASNKSILVTCILFDLSSLFFYKYLNFTILNVNSLFSTSWEIPGIALPIGISFYCFQCLSYVVDVYRGNVPAQTKLSRLALYISFFPQLIAGPIVRYVDVYLDLDNRKLDWNNCFYGFQRFAVGLAKKVLIADPMGLMADKVFSIPPSELSFLWAWIGIVCYGLQIFYDFSAYSDMAIGLGRVFNLHFLENFKYPYGADSVQDFWRKWHISLSSWLRDYVYIPLGGSRISPFRTLCNVWIVFLLCGIWHGAEWTFVIWGIWHGFGLTIERLGFSKVLQRMPYVLRNLWVFLFVSIGWAFFRSPDVAYSFDFIKTMLFLGNQPSFWDALPAYEHLTISWLLSLVVGILFAYPRINMFISSMKSTRLIGVLSFLLFVFAYIFAVTSTFSPFIYFRF